MGHTGIARLCFAPIGQSNEKLPLQALAKWWEHVTVHDPEEERTLEDTVQAALRQIQERQYEAKLKTAGFSEEKIRSYGFAFEGKKVLIG